jgi:hypothetical protein
MTGWGGRMWGKETVAESHPVNPVNLKPAVHLTADVADDADRRTEMTRAGTGGNLTLQAHGASYPSS